MSMHIWDLKRTVVCGAVALVTAGSLHTAALAGGFSHVGPATVSLKGAMWSRGGPVRNCGGFGLAPEGSHVQVAESSEEYGSWPMRFPWYQTELLSIQGGVGCETVASIVRNGSHIEFAASFDRVEMVDILEHIASEQRDEWTGKGAISFGTGDQVGEKGAVLCGSARFRLADRAAVKISADVSVENPVAGNSTFRSVAEWRIDRVYGGNGPELAGQLEVETLRSIAGTIAKGSDSEPVELDAGEYVVTYGFVAQGLVQRCYYAPELMRRSWASAEHARIRLSVEGGCEADLDGSGEVDGGDLAVLLMDYGCSGGLADFDGSGLVDGGDIAVLLLYYGPCG